MLSVRLLLLLPLALADPVLRGANQSKSAGATIGKDVLYDKVMGYWAPRQFGVLSRH